MMSLLTVCLLSSFLFPFGEALMAFKSMRYEVVIPTEPSGFISCVCGGWRKSKELPKNKLDQVFSSLVSRQFCTPNFPSEICDLIMDCSICTANMSSCNVAPNDSYSCVQSEVSIHGGHSRVNSNGLTKRVKRASLNCNFPSYMKTSDVHCVESAKRIQCTQRCIYGHTLHDGISREITCKFSENVWKPFGFEECSPFIDCTMSLTAPGSLFCITGTPYIPPQCDVSCGSYEDYPAVPSASYRCDSAGWTGKLPHCAQSGTGVQLVPAPQVRVHSEDGKLASRKDLNEKGQKKILDSLRPATFPDPGEEKITHNRLTTTIALDHGEKKIPEKRPTTMSSDHGEKKIADSRLTATMSSNPKKATK